MCADGSSTAVHFILWFEAAKGTWPAIYMLCFNMRVFDLTVGLMFLKLIKRFIVMSNPFNHFP